MIAEAIRDTVSSEIWNSYYKFAVVRNPWDRMVSVFWFRLAQRKGPTTHAARILTQLGMPVTRIMFHEMVRRRNAKPVRHDYVNMIMDASSEIPLVDDVLRYEDLNNEIERVRKKLGLPVIKIPRLKGQYRKDRRPYTEYYNRITKERVAEADRAIIKNYGYAFGS